MAEHANSVSRRRVVVAGLVGNVMEWYDFAVYGYLASVIGRQFFPSEDPAVSLIAAFGAFAAGFLVRPLGGLVFGRIGDLIGRRHALTLSVLAMALPTVLIALLPTYQTIGIAAPIVLVGLRMVQGLSAGGEYTSSIVFLVEHAPAGRRAFFAAWGQWGAVLGILLGSGIASLLATILDEAQFMSWGWRLPFLLGALVAATGYLIRSSLAIEEPASAARSPVFDSFGKHRTSVLRVILLNVGFAVSFYTAFVYAVSYIKEIDHLPEGVALDLNTGGMTLLLLILPLSAWLSDRYGRKPLLVTGSALLAFGAIPFFHLIHTTDPMTIFFGELGFIGGFGVLSGGINAANVELMPASVRCTGLAFAYNASMGCFGGTTPLIATWLVTATGNPITPAYWAAATAAVTLLTAIFLVRETRFDALR
jgi:MHS family proline/betaine transporter-like MFS transporter